MGPPNPSIPPEGILVLSNVDGKCFMNFLGGEDAVFIGEQLCRQGGYPVQGPTGNLRFSSALQVGRRRLTAV